MDLGKVTVFSGSPQQQSRPTLLQPVLTVAPSNLDDMAVLSAAQLLEKTWAAQPFLR